VSRSFGFSYFKSSQFNTSTSNIDNEAGQLSLQYGYPLSEYSSIRYGLQYGVNSLLSTSASSIQQNSFIQNNGDSSVEQLDFFGNIVNIFSTDFQALELLLGYNYDSRNNYLFATRGQRLRAGLNGSIPGSDVEYYSVNLNYLKYFPISQKLSLSYRGDYSFAEDFGDTTMLPPSKNLFSSNSTNIRGFRANYLGPLDSNGFPFGGNLRVINSLDLYPPVPEKLQGSMRYSLFVDYGNVFYQGNGNLFRAPNVPIERDVKFDTSNMRASTGVAIEWLSPLGLIGLSYGTPLKEKPGDEIERLQFNISQGF